MKNSLFILGMAAVLSPLSPVWADKDNAAFPDAAPEATETTPAETSTQSRSEGIELDRGAMIEILDQPTTEVLDAGTYGLNFRFYSQGGLVSRLLLSPFRRVQVGIAADAQNVIGAGDPRMIRPSVYFKLRAFDGTDVLPALALGYESQGYLYRRPAKRFLQDERGVYALMSHEIFLPDLELSGGVNIPNIEDEADIFGFVGFTYRITPSFALLTEYDNLRKARDHRFNLGGRFWVTPYFNVDVGARNVGRKSDRGAERVVILNYVAQFPF